MKMSTLSYTYTHTHQAKRSTIYQFFLIILKTGKKPKLKCTLKNLVIHEINIYCDIYIQMVKLKCTLKNLVIHEINMYCDIYIYIYPNGK